MNRLFTTAFPVSDPAREHEYAACLTKNLALEQIDQVCLLDELPDRESKLSSELLYRPTIHRPTYQDFFSWIDELAGPDDISIIANSDIYFDSSLAAVDRFLKPDECYALSRWDVQEDGSSRLFDRNDSQDAWIFRGPIRENLKADFPLGVPRCDNRLLHELQQAGYRVSNPAFSIRAHHLHAGKRPEYAESGDNFVHPPYAYLFPHNLKSLPATILHNRRFPDRRIGWRVDRRGVARAARRVVRCALRVGSWKRRA